MPRPCWTATTPSPRKSLLDSHLAAHLETSWKRKIQQSFNEKNITVEGIEQTFVHFPANKPLKEQIKVILGFFLTGHLISTILSTLGSYHRVTSLALSLFAFLSPSLF